MSERDILAQLDVTVSEYRRPKVTKDRQYYECAKIFHEMKQRFNIREESLAEFVVNSVLHYLGLKDDITEVPTDLTMIRNAVEVIDALLETESDQYS